MTLDLAPWRDQAMATVTEALYARHPELEQRFGARGKQVCREDIGYHLDYLQVALDTGEPAPFLNYARWLADILEHRGVPAGHLDESFALLETFFASHLPPEQAAACSAILGASRDTKNLPTAPYIQSRLPALPHTSDYRDAILSGNQLSAQSLMLETMREVNYGQAAVGMIQPALYGIGRLWQENRISVAQEHLATAISQNVLARAYMQAEFAPPNGRHAVFACVAGNQHSLGLRMLSDVFETAGWDAIYLGADVPLPDLIRLLDARRPQLLAISLSLPAQLAVTRDSIARIRSELGECCPEIWVGGLASLSSDRLWRIVRADGWAADALHALEQT